VLIANLGSISAISWRCYFCDK